MVNRENYLFIIWFNAYNTKKNIIKDIKTKYVIKEVYEICWSPKYFSNNLSRFYGGKLPPGCPKEQRIGKGPFTLIIVEDNNPNYGERLVRNHNIEFVNTNIFDDKMKYRKWAEGTEKVPDRIHATNTPKETTQDLTLLLGCNLKDFFKEIGQNKWDGTIKSIKRELVGARSWENINQLFYVLNSTINYVILRNFESLPTVYPLADKGDIDLLVENYNKTYLIMNAKPVCSEDYRVQNEVNIAGQIVRFDIRFVGDHYYDDLWEKKILKNKKLNTMGFYNLCDEDYFYTLLYHAIVHKPVICDDYRQRLTKMGNNLGITNIDQNTLDEYMEKMKYRYTRPRDKSVYYHINEKVKINKYVTHILRGIKKRLG